MQSTGNIHVEWENNSTLDQFSLGIRGNPFDSSEAAAIFLYSFLTIQSCYVIGF
jgi:hypothetical protein